MRRVLLSLACLLAFILCARAEQQRNVILILIDDQRFDALGYMGHPFLETPNLDRMAAHGVHFENAFVTTSLCSPSRASILTGLFAHNHRVVDNYHPVDDHLTFFPELLQQAGYETAFVGKWHMGDTEDPQRGFDHWVSFKGQGIYWPHETGLKIKGRYVPQAYQSGININGQQVDQKGYITDELTDYALDWLTHRASKDEKPYFLYLSHKAVHADFLPPNRYAYRYENEPVPRPKSWADDPSAFTDVPMWVQNQRNSRHGVEFAYYTELDLANYYRRYCEALLAVDDSVGRVLQHLQDNGELEDTVILFMGDNGFLFGEHGLIDKRTAYEESVRVPMIMHCPSLFPAGTRVPEIVANIDVAPTLLAAAGIAPPAHMDGRSFLPLAQGRPIADWREYLLYEYYWERNYPQTPTTHALIGRDWKYIRYHGIWDTDELFNLRDDPRETTNLWHHPDHQERVAELNAKLFAELKATTGMDLPLLPDRGTKFYHRKDTGSRGAEFPDWFYREAGTSGL
mgnify:CR=1 FL=1